MRSFAEDTMADKVFRFVLGACLGASSAWLLAVRGNMTEAREFAVLVASGAGGVGLLAVLFGNRFIETFLRRRWWS
jgi:hypothetical protein